MDHEPQRIVDPDGEASEPDGRARAEPDGRAGPEPDGRAATGGDPLTWVRDAVRLASGARRLDDVAAEILTAICTRLGLTWGAVLHWSGRTPSPLAVVGTPPPEPWTFADIPPPTADAADADAADADPAVHRGHDILVTPLLLGVADRATAALAVGPATALSHADRTAIDLIAIACAGLLTRGAQRDDLARSVHRFRRVFDASSIAKALILGQERRFRTINQALCDLTGHPRGTLLALPPRSLVHPADRRLIGPLRAAAVALPNEPQEADLRLVHATGRAIHVRLSLTHIDGPTDAPMLLGQVEDLTARRDADRALRQQAEIDPLTGLANRSGLVRELDRIEREGIDCAMIFMDLDGFKLINDTRGHEIGDEVLAEVATRLRSLTSEADFISRFGGDEFVVICRSAPPESTRGPGAGGGPTTWTGAAAPDDGGAPHRPAPPDPRLIALRASVRGTADRIQAALIGAIDTSTGPVHIHTSMGICDGSIPARIPSALLQRADTAMYQAKKLGKDRQVVYDEVLHAQAVEHRRTDATLRNALAEERFLLHYQPIVDSVTAETVGFEALVRLIDTAGTVVPPGRFIDVAEQSGLIVPLGAWVMRESCRRIAAVRTEVGRPLQVSVNVAARQAARADLTDIVEEALAESGLPPTALTLELTESALLEADSATLDRLNALRERGIHIALDDFGTGYSSLTYLQQLPLSHIKVDRSFVSGMVTNSDNRAIVRAVTWLANALRLEWVAEGVETIEQWNALQTLGHGLAQGYLFNRPLPAHLLGHAVRAEHRPDDGAAATSSDVWSTSGTGRPAP